MSGIPGVRISNDKELSKFPGTPDEQGGVLLPTQAWRDDLHSHAFSKKDAPFASPAQAVNNSTKVDVPVPDGP